ncbi:putative lipoprotein [Citrobacter freundii]|uniref:Lipoprotein n=1 Tax=Citrobacter freundii TaxID=546 RepID=A0A7G2IMA8_CITFR|nr:putative lipoprotein [Citrobacter freundii]
MSTVSRLYPLSGLAALVLVGCSSQPAQPLKKGEKAVDVASVVRQKNARQRERPGRMGAGFGKDF